MGKIPGRIIQPEAKVLFSCEPVKSYKLRAFKRQWCNMPRIGVPMPKGKRWKEKRGDKSQPSQKASEANSIRS